MRFALAAGVCSGLAAFAVAAEPAKIPAEHIEFFETHVRPVMVEHCLACHGEKKQQGNLRLDTLEALLKGNESGPAVVKGNPDESRLIQVIRYSNDDIQMPPSGKMTPEQIAALTKWVELGAPWPVDSASATPTALASATQTHWSFQPITDPPVPSVRSTDRVQDTIDAFILAKLEASGLTLSDPADKRTFIRRATLDLWGIPPTYEEVQAFVADTSTDAVPRLIERLLDSPLYGQRWARHWLDVARYADTKGYVFTEEPRYPYAYTYRDYVVDSFNADKPYDRFVMEQIAADQLELSEEQSELAALGFLTVGRRFLNKQQDIIDDRIDVVTRGLMSLTVTCARCHDHKYDPVPTADYYSLYGVFASSHEPDDLPIIGTPKSRAEFEKFQRELSQREQELAAYEQKTQREMNSQARLEVSRYLTLLLDPKATFPSADGKGRYEPRRVFIDRWKGFLAQRKDSQDRVFGPWNRLAHLAPEAYSGAMSAWLAEATNPDAAPTCNPLIVQSLADRKPATNIELAQAYGEALSRVETEWREHVKQHPEATALPDANAEELRQVLYAEGAPTNLNLDDSRKAYLRNERNQQRALVRKIDSLKVTSPGAPPRAMVMRDNDRPQEPRILIRGNPGRPGEQVPRQFLEVLAGDKRKPFSQGSGRLELARAIASPDNPLTARVIVNRVWQHHFGEGLVRTPGDFGLRGEAPTHPELLDHLASRFMQNGWSIKSLHRWIMTSAVYAQASLDRPECRQVDPENRLFWKMPRQRLELEALRDSWLAVSGSLDASLGGRPFDSITDPKTNRRTLYGLVNRNDLPGVFRSFDFADVDVSMAERPQTTVPQQALYAMNAPFVIEQARRVATATNRKTEATDRVNAMFQCILLREPTSEEREQALAFVQQAPHAGQLTNWDKLAQVLMLTNEFVFVD